MFENQKEIEII